MAAVSENFGGAQLMRRAIRGSAWIMFGYAGSQALRLGANLIVTRLLFPEAFGLMALVTVFIVGLGMFSDVGIGPSISHSKRGDDPEFLNTAWTIQIIRGFALWAAACALAWPVSQFYGETALIWLLPAAALGLAVSGFDPTRIYSANRHLRMGAVTRLDLLAQAIGIGAMIGFALVLNSVAALVIGSVVGELARLVVMHAFLPGSRNRLRWEPAAARELLHFGKWIFASTICGFFSSQGDRAILGKILTISMLGIYNIGYFLASFPIQLGYAVTGRILIPVYRETAAAGSPEAHRKLRLMRFGLTGGLLCLVLLMAFVGGPLVGLLYDDRYITAGAVVVAVACIQIPMVIGMSYDQAALAAGDSRGFFLLSLVRATLQMSLMLAGAMWTGLPGALIGLGIAALLVHPLIVVLAVRHQIWDASHDLTFGLIGGGAGAVSIWFNWTALMSIG